MCVTCLDVGIRWKPRFLFIPLGVTIKEVTQVTGSVIDLNRIHVSSLEVGG